MKYGRKLAYSLVMAVSIYVIGAFAAGVSLTLLVVSAICLVVFAAHDLGKIYMKMTNQTEQNKRIFSLIMTPPYVFAVVVGFTYALLGWNWYGPLLATMIAAALFIADFNGPEDEAGGNNS